MRSFRALVLPALPAALLLGCPQLLDDQFGAPGARSELTPDAKLPPGDAGMDASEGPDSVPRSPREVAGDGGVRPTSTPGADATADGGAALAGLRAALIHRYRFDGTGATVLDSVGTSTGAAVGAQLSGGAAVLAGTEPGQPQYVNLPNGLVSSLHNATLEAWVYWDVDLGASTSSWQRIFDFGDNSGNEDEQGDSANYIYLTPKSGGSGGKLHLEYRTGGSAAVGVDAPSTLPVRVEVQLVAVVNDDANTLSLYQDGNLQGSAAFPGRLSSIPDQNVWLGRSQYAGDPDFQGQILDFRIYDGALSLAQIRLSQSLGPDAEF